jgi:hypothetical protein
VEQGHPSSDQDPEKWVYPGRDHRYFPGSSSNQDLHRNHQNLSDDSHFHDHFLEKI